MITTTQYIKKKIISDNFLELAQEIDKSESDSKKVSVLDIGNNQFMALVEKEGSVEPVKEGYVDKSLAKAVYCALHNPRMFSLDNGEVAMALWNGDIVKRDLYLEDDKDCCIFNMAKTLGLPKSINSMSFLLSDKRILTFYQDSATQAKKAYLSELHDGEYVLEKEVPLDAGYYDIGVMYQTALEKRVYYFYFEQTAQAWGNGFKVFDDDTDTFQEHEFLPYYDDLDYFRQMAQNQIIVKDTNGSGPNYYMMHPKAPFESGFEAVLMAQDKELMDIYAVSYKLVYAFSTRGDILVFEEKNTVGNLEINTEKSYLNPNPGYSFQIYILGICNNKLWLFIPSKKALKSFDLETKEFKEYSISGGINGFWFPVVIVNDKIESPLGSLVFDEDNLTFKIDCPDAGLKEWYPGAFV